MTEPSKIACPKCGSDQLYAGKKGFSGKKAVAGAILTGGIGLLAGTIGSNKILINCLNCGHQWKPGQAGRPAKGKFIPTDKSKRLNKIILITLAIIMAFIILICCL